MRPQSIKMFDYLVLGSLALGLAGFMLDFDRTKAAIEASPTVAQAGFGTGFIIGTYLFGVALVLLLWFFISRMRSKVAKWIFIVLVAIGLAMLPGSLAQTPTLIIAIAVVNTLLQLAAIYYLFRPDAKAWFAKEEVDSSTFE